MTTDRPFRLPPLTDAWLRPLSFAAITVSTEVGTIVLAKAPAADIESCRGSVPIVARYELHVNEYGPVLRLLLVIRDRAEHSLLLETFGNVSDPVQLAEWRDLLSRPELRLLFVDEQHRRRLGKGVRQPNDDAARSLIPEALRLLKAHDPSMLDFDRAKAIVVAANPLADPGDGAPRQNEERP